MSHYPNLAKNYGPTPFDAERGEGVYLYDTKGKRYLDFSSGIAVNALGHGHPLWVKAVQEQAASLVHCSNLFGIPSQQRLADRLIERAGSGRILFCNSGAESNEALIKLARLHGRERAGGKEGQCYGVVCADNAFHGRTFGGMAATPQEKIQGGFRPMLDGFSFGILNDIKSFENAIDASTAAVFIESIQGEGGVFPADTGFLKELRALCTERGVLLLLDEVQCGIGRTGHFFAFEKSGVQPDAIGMAKGLGGGFPIGAIWMAESCAELYQPGSHGTTFGGNPLACAAAHAVLDAIEQDQLLEHVQTVSVEWHSELKQLVESFPATVAEVRGEGFMVGLALKKHMAEVVSVARDKGLLIVPAGHETIRLLPPLIATAENLNESVQILKAVLSELA
ncbi:MAG: acetylornithine/succinylornithine family transaminase [Verrucomicrobia bacterium]|nr:acetylornithine/succinylornithine family transaminase [Verrucomicrobiota bacterium]